LKRNKTLFDYNQLTLPPTNQFNNFR